MEIVWSYFEVMDIVSRLFVPMFDYLNKNCEKELEAVRRQYPFEPRKYNCSPRVWFGRFTQCMRCFGYKQSNSDHTLFLKHQKGKVTVLIIYVDDMVITGDDLVEIGSLQKKLASEFEMKNLGDLKYFLGIEVARGRDDIFLCQRKYVLDLLAETGMLDCCPIDTPIEQNHKLAEYPDQVPTDKSRYQRLVGHLIYLSHTRPDVAYAVSVVTQFMHNPSERHMKAVVRILRYLKSAPGKGLMFFKYQHLNVSRYTDADWVGSITDRKSTSGYFTLVGGNLVSWRSKKQKVVARSSAEAEYRGMAHGVCELLWLRNLLRDLGFKPKSAMQLYCDNKAAIDISHNPVQHDRTKHVEVDRHFIKEKLDAKLISFRFVPTEEQLANILTKAVSSKLFHDSQGKLGLRDDAGVEVDPMGDLNTEAERKLGQIVLEKYEHVLSSTYLPAIRWL
ncbi:putative RNA-directed DNA polymerase [Rosa chinensis]|uniref:Putative RNA-directed DNA polymerase n=1 Tax=Rosa chinensis TaxID=74649 RepID=A0A2P6QAC2_ROSCH|nr:putative RNA-directed DNA polymerase [Rosa chinensis]